MDQQVVDTFLENARATNDAQLRPCRLVTDAFIPLPAHRVGVAHLFLRPRFVLGDGTGLGKTPQALVAYGYLKEKDPSLKALVATPKGAQFQWQGSAERFLSGVRAAVVGFNDRRERLSQAARTRSYGTALQQADVWITTYALLAKEIDQFLGALDNYVLILDEAHTVRNFRTARPSKDGEERVSLYGGAKRASEKARCVWALTATPQFNDKLDELYSIFELVRPGTFGPYSAFRKTYFRLKLERPMWKDKRTGQRARPFYKVLGYQNQGYLEQAVRPFFLRRPADLIKTGLPAITYRVEDVFLPAKHQSAYEDLVAHRWPGSTTKIEQLAALTAAQQLVDAPEILGFPQLGNAKADALVELLQGELADQKVLVYSKFAEVIGILGQRLAAEGINYGTVTGDDSAAAREATRVRFAKSSGMKVILLTDAGGEALDLQAAGVIVFYDLPWSFGRFQQVIGRARRIGSAHANVLATLLVANKTIDATVLATLARKEKTIRSLLRQGLNSTHDTLTAQLTTTPLSTATTSTTAPNADSTTTAIHRDTDTPDTTTEMFTEIGGAGRPPR